MIPEWGDKNAKVVLSADNRKSDVVAPAGRQKYLLLLKKMTPTFQSFQHGHALLVNVMPLRHLALPPRAFAILLRAVIQLPSLPLRKKFHSPHLLIYPNDQLTIHKPAQLTEAAKMRDIQMAPTISNLGHNAHIRVHP